MQNLEVRSEAVFDNRRKKITLSQELGSGGQGRVYSVGSSHACKIFHPSRLTVGLTSKLQLMVSCQIDSPYLCWPLDITYDSLGKPNGYMMKRGFGTEIQKSIFVPRPVFEKHRPDWTRVHLLKIISAMLDVIVLLHDNDVIIGDINSRNILVTDDQNVCFVDCDSFQIGQYPCPVCMPSFLAPELDGVDLKTTLRTQHHENFSVATMIFMMLHPGKSPYSHQGGGSVRTNLQRRHFPYSRGNQGAKGVPLGPWRYSWSHLPRYMKDAFHRVFTDDDRLSLSDWREYITRYQNDLAKQHCTLDIYPDGFKQLNQYQAGQAGAEWRPCIECNKSFAFFGNGIPRCQNCSRRNRRRGESWQAATNL